MAGMYGAGRSEGAYNDEIISEEKLPNGRGSGFYGKSEEVSGTERLIRVFLIIACIAAGAVLVWLLGVTPFLPFSRIAVSPIEGLSREEILVHSRLGPASSFITTDSRAVERALKVLPQIEQARVFKHFPDRLEIALEGRKAVALAFARIGDKTVPVYFDVSGVIFRIGAGTDDASPVLPVISGLLIENPVPGMRLPLVFTPLLSELEVLKVRAPELLSAISEIEINRKEASGFDLIVYPVQPRIRVRLSELNEDILKYALLMVDVLSAREPDIGFIDFRSGVASYNMGDK